MTMPRKAKELSALEIKRLKHPGTGRNVTFSVGGISGLLLQITPNGGRSWLLRVAIAGKRREIGLGGFPDVPLSQARDRARELKDQIRRGIDPVEERRRLLADLAIQRRRGMTFSDASDQCLAARLDGFQNSKHRQQWKNTLQTYAMPVLGKLLVDEITVQDVLQVLEPIWRTKTTTASRVRGRIETVLAWATVAGHRDGDNPARWAGNLKELLPPATKIAVQGHHPALQIDDAPRWFSALRKRKGVGARAVEFAAITAARSKEIRGARWEEVDLVNGIWTIPASRMKMDREHRVPLSRDAVTLLEALPRFHDNSLVFPSSRGGEMSDMTLSATMKRMHETDIGNGGSGFLDRVSKRPAVPHGLRSTFRDWVAERTHFAGDMAEIALAHKLANAVEASYRRGDMIEKRRRMMASWAEFLSGDAIANSKVVQYGS